MAATAPGLELTPKQLDTLRRRLREDWPFYAPRCLRIIDKRGQIVPFVPRASQLRLDAALEAQRAAGRPMRAIILKARQLGFSTAVQGKIIQRVTQQPNHAALVVAHDTKTAGRIFDMGKLMWAKLPDMRPTLDIRPPLAQESNTKGSKSLLFGEPARNLRRAGELGLNSTIFIDTARELAGGRGLTIRSLHLSEVAFYPADEKLLGLMQGVPDDPDSLIALESTANGHNHFKDWWDRAVAGDSSYVPIFAAWHEDPEYALPFASGEEREQFREKLGTGPYGEDEPSLMETFGLSLEQLQWRRVTIADKCGGSVDKFRQEYPSTPEEAFLTTGKTVFAVAFLNAARKEAERAKQAQVRKLEATGRKQRKARRNVTIAVPTGARLRDLRVGERGGWRVWEEPFTHERVSAQARAGELPMAVAEQLLLKPEGQYVIGVDTAGGEDVDVREGAQHAIEVINHRTLRQVAEYVSQEDPDELAEKVHLAALLYNGAWVAVETTGGWGGPVARKLAIDLHYPRVYTRVNEQTRTADWTERLGWDTSKVTRPILEANMHEALREGNHGIRSVALVREMFTYVDVGRGRHRPERGKHNDRMMAYLIARQVALEKPVRDGRPRGSSTSTRKADAVYRRRPA